MTSTAARSITSVISETRSGYAVTSLFTGTRQHPIYADRLVPAERSHEVPVVMIHGGCNTGSCFLLTPDGRPGWAHDFAAAGLETFVVDWPGHGRSPMRGDFVTMSSRDVRDALAAMLRQIGPAILLAHSAGGPLIWSLAEACDDLVAGLIGIAPGPPANLVPTLEPADGRAAGVQHDAEALPIMAEEGAPFFVDETFVADYWFTGPAAPARAAENFYRSVVPESPRIINERFNVAGSGLRVEDAALVGRRPALVVGPECDPRHPRHLDAGTAALFGADFMWLPDRGIRGNGHMMMADANSADISAAVIEWIIASVPDARS